ncbi:MAG: flotillin family protein [Desulfobacteraceae bacterium]|nr:flotillin family protein [Desulfobacteraceae bacterium]
MSVSATIIVLILVAIALVVLFFIFYKRASKEIAFVRTGFGGEKIVKNRGAVVIPVLHEVIEVNMKTLRLEVQRQNEQSVITRDRMRMDIVVEFYVHVAPDLNAISIAASTLGSRTMRPDALNEIVEGKFIDAIRSIAAEMTMEELHAQRKNFIGRVREAVAEDLSRNGLELEAASLTQLDQTEMSYFNPSNAFDAEGLTHLTEKIESRKKKRNDIEQDTRIQIRNKNLETEKLNLALELEEQSARLEQQLEIEIRKAEQTAEITLRRAEQSQGADQAEIVARQKVEIAKILSERDIEEERLARERALREREIEKEKMIRLAEHARDVEVSIGSKAQSEAKAEAEAARADLVTAEERVLTAREKEAAGRRKAVELIEAAREAERQALALKIMAEAEKAAAVDQAEAEKIKAAGNEVRFRVEAAGTRALNEAKNLLSPEQITAEIRHYLIDHLAEIIHESGKPLEKIDSIKIVQADGLWGNDRTKEGIAMSDRVFDSALRYRAQAPLVDSLLRELGLAGINIMGVTNEGDEQPASKDEKG